MIKRYRYGQPISTDTIVKSIPICDENIAFFQLENKEKMTFTYIDVYKRQLVHHAINNLIKELKKTVVK